MPYESKSQKLNEIDPKSIKYFFLPRPSGWLGGWMGACMGVSLFCCTFIAIRHHQHLSGPLWVFIQTHSAWEYRAIMV